MKIVLVSCVAKKADIEDGKLLPAKELYISPLFQKAYAYAKSLMPDKIYILSAKHGLLEPDDLICKYNESLYSKTAKDRTEWGDNVLKSLQNIGIDIQKDEFIFLAGKIYCKHLIGKDKIENYNIVYKGLTGIGHILNFLNSKLNTNGMKISKVSLLRDNKFKLIDKKPGFYRWWFKEEAAYRLIKDMKKWLPEEDKFLTMDHEGDKYIALYYGISKDMRGRIRWHASQKHTSSNINKGFLSTLRQTLSALLETPMSISYQTINDFIDNNCIWEWSYTNTKADAEVFEKNELSKKYYYPLNVKDNKTICENALKWLIGVRAEYRH